MLSHVTYFYVFPIDNDGRKLYGYISLFIRNQLPNSKLLIIIVIVAVLEINSDTFYKEHNWLN